jgi:hypothetical protein
VERGEVGVINFLNHWLGQQPDDDANNPHKKRNLTDEQVRQEACSVAAHVLKNSAFTPPPGCTTADIVAIRMYIDTLACQIELRRDYEIGKGRG